MDIRVNEIKEPLGLDEEKPVFSWKFRAAEKIWSRGKCESW